jgi:hypothetical protein
MTERDRAIGVTIGALLCAAGIRSAVRGYF